MWWNKTPTKQPTYRPQNRRYLDQKERQRKLLEEEHSQIVTYLQSNGDYSYGRRNANLSVLNAWKYLSEQVERRQLFVQISDEIFIVRDKCSKMFEDMYELAKVDRPFSQAILSSYNKHIKHYIDEMFEMEKEIEQSKLDIQMYEEQLNLIYNDYQDEFDRLWELERELGIDS